MSGIDGQFHSVDVKSTKTYTLTAQATIDGILIPVPSGCVATVTVIYYEYVLAEESNCLDYRYRKGTKKSIVTTYECTGTTPASNRHDKEIVWDRYHYTSPDAGKSATVESSNKNAGLTNTNDPSGTGQAAIREGASFRILTPNIDAPIPVFVATLGIADKGIKPIDYGYNKHSEGALVYMSPFDYALFLYEMDMAGLSYQITLDPNAHGSGISYSSAFVTVYDSNAAVIQQNIVDNNSPGVVILAGNSSVQAQETVPVDGLNTTSGHSSGHTTSDTIKDDTITNDNSVVDVTPSGGGSAYTKPPMISL